MQPEHGTGTASSTVTFATRSANLRQHTSNFGLRVERRNPHRHLLWAGATLTAIIALGAGIVGLRASGTTPATQSISRPLSSGEFDGLVPASTVATVPSRQADSKAHTAATTPLEAPRLPTARVVQTGRADVPPIPIEPPASRVLSTATIPESAMDVVASDTSPSAPAAAPRVTKPRPPKRRHYRRKRSSNWTATFYQQ